MSLPGIIHHFAFFNFKDFTIFVNPACVPAGIAGRHANALINFEKN